MAFLDSLEVLIPRDHIARRVSELGAQITRDYQGKSPILLGVLKGSFVFVADLARAIDLPIGVEFLGVRSYGDATTSSGEVEVTHDLSRPIHNEDVLIVEDIVDTGTTSSFLLEQLATRHPRSVKLCGLLHKPSRALVQVPIDYVGFTIEDHFVVGYGLDAAQRYRNLPDICVLKAQK
jgi:hypoxanthine phosphoribosyltransferase